MRRKKQVSCKHRMCGAKIEVEIYHDQLRDDVYSRTLSKEQLCLSKGVYWQEETYKPCGGGAKGDIHAHPAKLKAVSRPGKVNLPRTSHRSLDLLEHG